MEKKFNLVVPLAGKAKRFLNEGFKMPKPLLFVKDEMIIDWTMDCIEWEKCNLIFIVRAEHVSNFQIDEVLRNKFGHDIKIVVANHDTQGSVCSVMLAMEHINNDLPLIVHCSDIYFTFWKEKIKFDPEYATGSDGYLLTFKSNSSNYSYCQLAEDDTSVLKVVEKQVVSNDANVGIYYFKHGSTFVKYARQMIEMNDTTNGEFFIAPLYNHIIKDGLRVHSERVDKMYIFGTPNELKFFSDCILNTVNETSVIGLASDHSGWKTKEQCKRILDKLNVKYIDYGSYSLNASDYVTYSDLVVKAIQNKVCTHGMTFCKTGQGQNMYMNKFNFIRNALVWNKEMTEMSIRHNCANTWSIPSDYVDADILREIIDAILSNTFDGGRHQTRVMKLMGLV